MNEDLKRCCKCKMDCLKTNFFKRKNVSNGFYLQCISCGKINYNENRDRVKQYHWILETE